MCVDIVIAEGGSDVKTGLKNHINLAVKRRDKPYEDKNKGSLVNDVFFDSFEPEIEMVKTADSSSMI